MRNLWNRSENETLAWSGLKINKMQLREVSVFGFFLVCIFLCLNWIRRDIEYLFVSIPNAGKCRAVASFFPLRWLNWRNMKHCLNTKKILTKNSARENSKFKTFRCLRNKFEAKEIIQGNAFAIYIFKVFLGLKICPKPCLLRYCNMNGIYYNKDRKDVGLLWYLMIWYKQEELDILLYSLLRPVLESRKVLQS